MVYAALLGGKTAKVVGKSEDGLWWAISVPVVHRSRLGELWLGDRKWSRSCPVLPTPPVPPTTELIPPAESDPQVVVIANSYVRTGPAINYPAYGVTVALSSASPIASATIIVGDAPGSVCKRASFIA